MDYVDNQINQEVVDARTSDLLEAFLKTYYDKMEHKVDMPLEIEDLIANLQAATELLASMVATTATVIHVAQNADQQMTLPDIIEGILTDTRGNLDGAVNKKIEMGAGPAGRIIIAPWSLQ